MNADRTSEQLNIEVKSKHSEFPIPLSALKKFLADIADKRRKPTTHNSKPLTRSAKISVISGRKKVFPQITQMNADPPK